MNSEPNKQDSHLHDDVVALNFRYGGAWNEINTRISQRQNLISIFTALMLPILGGALLHPESGGLIRAASYGIPALSLLFAILLLMHEVMIGSLVRFCCRCEDHNNHNSRLPSYHLDAQHYQTVRRIRQSHDAACFFLGIVFQGAAIGVLCNHYFAVPPEATVPVGVFEFWIAVIYGVAGMIVYGLLLNKVRQVRRADRTMTS